MYVDQYEYRMMSKREWESLEEWKPLGEQPKPGQLMRTGLTEPEVVRVDEAGEMWIDKVRFAG